MNAAQLINQTSVAANALPRPYYDHDGITIYHGDNRKILPLLKADHIITDPPYSEMTHSGHNASSNSHKGFGNDGARRSKLEYSSLSESDCLDYARIFSSICSGWIVWMTDHLLAPCIQECMESAGRYVFAPLPFFAPGSRVRLAGDGPSSWTIWIVVSRTKAQAKWGTLPGGYVAGPGWNDSKWIGGKPTKLMTAIMRDYSREGETVLDPFMGAGTTLDAAKQMGRKAIGIDIDEKACEIAAARVSQGNLFTT